MGNNKKSTKYEVRGTNKKVKIIKKLSGVLVKSYIKNTIGNSYLQRCNRND